MLPIQGLNAAFQPRWQQPEGYMNPVTVPDFTTDQLNPQWAKWLDAYGASDPGGEAVKMGGLQGLPRSTFAVAGLQAAAPQQVGDMQIAAHKSGKQVGDIQAAANRAKKQPIVGE